MQAEPLKPADAQKRRPEQALTARALLLLGKRRQAGKARLDAKRIELLKSNGGLPF